MNDTRETSRIAHDQLEPSISKIYSVIAWVLNHSSIGPMTSREIDATAASTGETIESDKRMAEMVRHDLVDEVDRRKCSVTGRLAITYGTTGRPMTKDARPRKKSLRQQLDQALADKARLEKEIASLKAKPQQTSLLTGM